MNKKTVVRRTAAATGTCLIGLTMAACQSSSGTVTAESSPTAVSTSALTLPAVAPTATASQANPSAGPTSAATDSAGGSNGSGSGSGSGSVSSFVAACTGSQIRVTTGHGGVGMGNVGMTLIFTNTSDQPCSLTGYPGAELTYADGHQWNATREMQIYAGGDGDDKTPMIVVLKPGSPASDMVGWSDMAKGGQSCANTGSTALLVTAPGTSDSQVIKKGETDACLYFTVTPVVPGTTGSK